MNADVASSGLVMMMMLMMMMMMMLIMMMGKGVMKMKMVTLLATFLNHSELSPIPPLRPLGHGSD